MIMAVGSIVSKKNGNESRNQPPDPRAPLDNDVVAVALAYIAAHNHRRIGPDDVARAVGTGTRTLQDFFRNTLKRLIATEIRRVRIERGKRELA